MKKLFAQVQVIFKRLRMDQKTMALIEFIFIATIPALVSIGVPHLILRFIKCTEIYPDIQPLVYFKTAFFGSFAKKLFSASKHFFSAPKLFMHSAVFISVQFKN
jgi:hypothetical protein